MNDRTTPGRAAGASTTTATVTTQGRAGARRRSPSAPAEAEAIAAPHGYWQRENAHAPRPLTPLTATLYLPVESGVWHDAFAEQGLPADRLELRRIGVWTYLRVVPIGEVDRPSPPPLVLWPAMRVLPEYRRRARAARAARATDLNGRLLREWFDVERARFERRGRELRDVDLSTLDDAALADHWRAARRLLEDGIRCHFRLHPAHQLARFELVDCCARELGWSDARTLDLLGGLSTASTEPARALTALVRLAANGAPALVGLVERADRSAVDELRAVDGGFADAFAEYLRDYGRRTLGYELASPTLAELPELVLATIRDQLSSGFDPDAVAARHEAARAELETEARSHLRGERLARFEAALARAQMAHGVEEDNVFFATFQPLGVARSALLEVGARARARGRLDARDDVFLLEADELERLLRGDVPPGLRSRIDERRAALDAASAPGGRRPPDSYGRPGAQPPSWTLPAAMRPLARALAWAMEHAGPRPDPFAVDAEGGGPGAGDAAAGPSRSADGARATSALVATGIGASAGRRTGTVRVVRDEGDLSRIRAGDVLVCPVTSPTWSIVYSRIGALVTDIGGMLSHPAIIAREFGLPAVLATGDATTRLRDGDVVTVDGTAGVVLAAARPLPDAEHGEAAS